MTMIFKHEPVELVELTATTTESGRLYNAPDGQKLPSITTVLSILSRDGIAAWRKKVGDEQADRIMHRASTRGTAVHELIEKYIDNDDNYTDGYTPDIIASFLDLQPILDTRIGKVYAQEAPLYSTHLGVAGRVDCVAEFDGKISIIDFKTSKKPKSAKWITNYYMQEAAYAIMWEERTGMPITQLVTLITVDGHSPQVFIEHRDNWVRPLKQTIAQHKAEQAPAPLLDV